MSKIIHVVGAGLAGSEASWFLANKGFEVVIHEMRPEKMTPAHKSALAGELVCSNSFKSEDLGSPAGLLKNEMSHFGSLILAAASHAKVDAGKALAVERESFSKFIDESLRNHSNITFDGSHIEEVPKADDPDIWIIATGPLTSDPLAKSLAKTVGKDHLAFYDAIAPIVSLDSLDQDEMFWGNRYDMESKDYLNIPLSKDQYIDFIDKVNGAEKTKLHDFEDVKYFESCLPIEVMAERGVDTLRFGPLKPVGFEDPKTGRRPYALIQLRKEDSYGNMMGFVGFQSKMKWPEQSRVLRELPGLAQAEFLRFGSIHRNTYLHGPSALNSDLSLRALPNVFVAGQITGVEGYTESSAIGIMAGLFVYSRLNDLKLPALPDETVLGSLLKYVTEGGAHKDYSPMNANFGLLPPLVIKQEPGGKFKKLGKKERKNAIAQRTEEQFSSYFKSLQEVLG